MDSLEESRREIDTYLPNATGPVRATTRSGYDTRRVDDNDVEARCHQTKPPTNKVG